LLILFDLDDTLIDTSGSILPYRFRRIVDFLLKNGAKVPSLDHSLIELQKSLEKTNTTEEAVKNFLESFHLAKEFFPIALTLLNEPLSENVKISLVPGAKEILQDLHPFHDLGLVTKGDPDLQKQKWEKAGLDSALFCKIVVVEPNKNTSKKEAYEVFVKEKKRTNQQVVVCGDHILRDLLPAKELGFWTVLMRWGKGKRWREYLENVDFFIDRLQELKKIAEYLEKKEKE
jgi:putative hydrolase of the HAD superfamily